MKTITITGHNRPKYLKQVLDSLGENNLSEYSRLFCGLEPDCYDNYLVCKEVNFIQKEIRVNPEKFGVRKNPFELLKHAFESGSEFNVYLEDDSIISPDCLDMCNWFYNLRNRDDFLCLNFYNYNSDETKPTLMTDKEDFCSLGFAVTKEAWAKYFEPYWNNEEYRISQGIDLDGIGGWDWCIRAVMKGFNIPVLTPCFSRSMHIGRELGTHCSPECHDFMFGNKKYNQTIQKHFEFI